MNPDEAASVKTSVMLLTKKITQNSQREARKTLGKRTLSIRQKYKTLEKTKETLVNHHSTKIWFELH